MKRRRLVVDSEDKEGSVEVIDCGVRYKYRCKSKKSYRSAPSVGLIGSK